jgi:phage regulator Rha-like protein
MVEKKITTTLMVQANKISVIRVKDIEYISLTDIAKYANPTEPSFTIKDWIRRADTVNFIGLWEKLYNPKFNLAEFAQIKTEYGVNKFYMSPTQWVKRTRAIGIKPSSGKYSIGTFAHPDIAFEFASWISPEFKLYLIKEFERLKQDEAYRQKIVWSAHREIAKTNYLIHTQAIKDNLVPKLTQKQQQFVYADEADMLNVVLFGMTAKQWRDKNHDLTGNIRDYASDSQLKTLINLENTNAQLIKDGKNQKTRILLLHQLAVEQMGIFAGKENKRLKDEIE